MENETKTTADTETVTCAHCCCPAGKPFRRVFNGKIIEGCISAFHTGHIHPSNEASLAWHNRESAQAWRRKSKFDFNPETGFWCK